jgi:hypothetical protein
MNRLETGDLRHPSPPLLLVAIIYTVLFVGSLALSIAMAGGVHYPSPFGPPVDALRYFADHADAVRVAAFLHFGSAIPLGIFTATAVSRLRFLGVQAAGTNIALFGGIGASLMLMLSALVSWVLSQSGAAALGPTLHALHLFAFAAGGPGHVVALGLLVAGVSISGGVPRLLPRWVMWFGLTIAALAELSTLSLLSPALLPLLPAARFLAFVWLIAVGAQLPAQREDPAQDSSRALRTAGAT